MQEPKGLELEILACRAPLHSHIFTHATLFLYERNNNVTFGEAPLRTDQTQIAEDGEDVCERPGEESCARTQLSN